VARRPPGTTNTGAIDPLPALADLCGEEDLWLHADAAYGGAVLISPRGKTLLAGIERVDSLALDRHKWLFQPYEIGSVLVRDRGWLRETFATTPEYLRNAAGVDEEPNFCEYGPQLTRSFRALKLWMSLQVFGSQAFALAVERGIELAEETERMIRALPGWKVMTPAQLGIVTFRRAPDGLAAEEADALNEALVSDLIADGFAMVSSTRLRGRVAATHVLRELAHHGGGRPGYDMQAGGSGGGGVTPARRNVGQGGAAASPSGPSISVDSPFGVRRSTR
jgi:glutamate/tyrosine decarboxylase-like PLP-dependent enzyme